MLCSSVFHCTGSIYIYINTEPNPEIKDDNIKSKFVSVNYPSEKMIIRIS